MIKPRWLCLFWMIAVAALAKEHEGLLLKKAAVNSARYFDCNRIRCAVMNNATFTRHPISGNSDFYLDDYSLIYTSGLWLAAKVNGKIRVSTADFSSDYVGGAIDGQGNPYGKEDSTFRVYRIVRSDHAGNNPDYAAWPIQQGAPADQQGNPLLMGDQTLWCSFTDAYLENRLANITPPLGAEVHLTVWGWNALDHVMFLRWEIINKSNDKWDDAYLGIYSDPDVLDANNDLVGSDSTLALVYCYDAENRYGYAPFHAVGYQFLESPAISSPGDTAMIRGLRRVDHKNIPVYSPRMEKNLSRDYGWNDIYYLSDQTAQYFYNRLQCLNYFGEPAIDPLTHRPSCWAFSGDPIAGTGWLDNSLPPRDRRMMLSTGPITVAAGDTIWLTAAIIAHRDNLRLENIAAVKRTARLLQELYRQQFALVANAAVTIDVVAANEVDVHINAGVHSEINLSQAMAQLYNYRQELVHSIELYDDGDHNDGLAGDHQFGNSWNTTPRDESLYLDLVLVDGAGKAYRFGHAVEKITLSHSIYFEPIISADGQNFDGEANPGETVFITYSIKNDYLYPIRKLALLTQIADPMMPLKFHWFELDSVPAASYAPMNFDMSERYQYLYFDIPAMIGENYQIRLRLDAYDDAYHHWQQNLTIPVKPYLYVPYETRTTQISGKSDGYFTIRIISPPDLTGHDYTISLTDSQPYFRFNLKDLTLDKYLLVNHPLPDWDAFNMPITDGFKIVNAFLPRGELRRAEYQDIPGGHPAGFQSINASGQFFNGGVSLGTAARQDFYAVEIEFTNNLDNRGVVGAPAGQHAFRFKNSIMANADAFLPNPFYVWKIWRGQRIGKLNACFVELPGRSTFNNVWAPDASANGGQETLCIMSSDYDSTGQLYLNLRPNQSEILYWLYLRLTDANSVVDAGDKFILDWEYPATVDDRFVFTTTPVFDQADSSQPYAFDLLQNYPNPFNPLTSIRFSLDKPSPVRLTIYNLLGQQVRVISDKKLPAGIHEVAWDGTDRNGNSVASGLYFARLIAADASKVIKMILIR
ncbi:MAG: T9SS type A sorting domain-containing protein [candidate division KSB1 bacterium]|nr:T9SS type A sorting domain-containing protein [candidate division KSB1 bacterium]